MTTGIIVAVLFHGLLQSVVWLEPHNTRTECAVKYPLILYRYQPKHPCLDSTYTRQCQGAVSPTTLVLEDWAGGIYIVSSIALVRQVLHPAPHQMGIGPGLNLGSQKFPPLPSSPPCLCTWRRGSSSNLLYIFYFHFNFFSCISGNKLS